jgi:hypothetical protein
MSLDDRQGIVRDGEETRQAYTPLHTFRQAFCPDGQGHSVFLLTPSPWPSPPPGGEGNAKGLRTE